VFSVPGKLFKSFTIFERLRCETSLKQTLPFFLRGKCGNIAPVVPAVEAHCNIHRKNFPSQPAVSNRIFDPTVTFFLRTVKEPNGKINSGM